MPSLEITAEVWSLSIELARKARSAGLTVSSTDLLILACSRHHQAPLEHCDQHFTASGRALGS